jgi:hypothetical protein
MIQLAYSLLRLCRTQSTTPRNGAPVVNVPIMSDTTIMVAPINDTQQV